MNLFQIQIKKNYIFKLSNRARKEDDYNLKLQLNKELKEKIEEVLQLKPKDTEMLTQLMYVNINLGNYEEAKEIGYAEYQKFPNKKLLRGLITAEEKSENYTKALSLLEEMLKLEPNNEFVKKRIEKIKGKENAWLQTKYREIANLERRIRELAKKEQKRIIIRRKLQKL